MSEKYYSILTNRGKALEAESAASGKPVILKDFVIGDGNGQAVTPDPANTTLVHEVYRDAISSLAVSSEQDNQFIAQLVLPADIGGFTVREVGLLTDSGELYAVGNCAAIEKPESGVSVRLQFRLAVNETADIELKVATGDGLFLRQDANLSDVKDKAESRKNIGLGTAATKDTGTSGATIPLLSTANTWSEVQTFKKDISVGTGGAVSVINIGNSQIIRDNGKTGLIITSSSGTITEGGAGIYLRPKGSTDSAMELHGNASGWNVDKLAVTTFSVNGATSLKGGATITNGALIYGEMNSVMNRTENYPNGSYVNGGLVRSFMFGRGAHGDTRGAFTSLYIQEFVGSYNQAVLNLNGFGNDNSWLFRNDGSFHSPGSVGVGNAFLQGDGNIWGTRWNSNGAWLWDSIVGLVDGRVDWGGFNNFKNSVVTGVRLSGLVWGGKIGNNPHDWGGGQVMTAVRAWENYAINMEFGLRSIQVLINGQWLNISSL